MKPGTLRFLELPVSSETAGLLLVASQVRALLSPDGDSTSQTLVFTTATTSSLRLPRSVISV